MVADERLGVPLDETLAGAPLRMRSSDLEQVALVAALQRETGGNTAEVLDRVAETVRGAVRAPAARPDADGAGTHVALGLSAAPRRLLVLMTLINPAYIAPLFSTRSAGSCSSSRR